MNLRHTYAIAYRYLLLLKGNGTRIFQLFVWGTLDVIVWGFLTKYLNAVGQADFSFTPVLLGAVVFFQIMGRAQQGVSTPFLEDIWSRNLLNFFASPLSVYEYLLGLGCTSILMCLISGTFIVVFASIVFGFSLWTLGLPALAFLLLLFIFGLALGIVGISIILRWGPSAEWFVWPIPTIISPFVGVFYPVSVLPQWMQAVSKVIPVSYVFENLRSVVINGTYSTQGLEIAAILDVIVLAATCALFLYIFRRARESGAIARYSAESFQ